MNNKGSKRPLPSDENLPSTSKRSASARPTDHHDDECPKLQLDLRQWTRCIVKQIQREKKKCKLRLHIHEEKNVSNLGEVRLLGPWFQTKVRVGTLISIQAKWDSSIKCYKVDKDDGFVVTNPDMLISETMVVESLFCPRKVVLQERYHGIEVGSKIMVISSLVRKVVQTVLAGSVKTRKQIEEVVKKVIESPEITFTLYECKMSRQEARLEVQKFTGQILSFVQHYIEGKKSKEIKGDAFQGKIDKIMDIEENLWVPQLGLKGKIDASVKIHRKKSRHPIPLQLKTGPALFSEEHKSQLILYQMMLTAIGQQTDFGLLLYLEEGIMKEVRGTRNEQRDLIMLRNELSYYLTLSRDVVHKEIKAILRNPMKSNGLLELPHPISNPIACKNCPYATICCSVAQAEKQFKLPDDHPLREVVEVSINHLRGEDITYFIQWTNFLSLEEIEQIEMKKSNNFQNIWNHPPSMRQSKGRAVMNLHLKRTQSLPNERYLHIFELEKENELDITKLEFALNDYVIVSTQHRIAIASGFIDDLTKHSITINLERKLILNYRRELFIVDKHESEQKHEQNVNYANLGMFLNNTDASNNLRTIILRRRYPLYSKSEISAIDPKAVWEILKPLNMFQKQAITEVVGTDCCLLINIPPGTGQNYTIVALIRLLVLANKTLILTSHTHSAVDQVLLRLKPYNLRIIRLGAKASIHPDLSQYSEHVICPASATDDDLEAVYNSFDIVAVTCLDTDHPMFTHRRFDYCIVNEATRVLQPTILRPLLYASKFVLIGDPRQLPPIVRSIKGRTLTSKSLFEILDSPMHTIYLPLQYRMNENINSILNRVAYSGQLLCYDKTVGTGVLTLTKLIMNVEWVEKCLHSDIEQTFVIVDTLDCFEHNKTFESLQTTDLIVDQHGYEKRGKGLIYKNYCEAAVIFELVTTLLNSGINPNRIGVIAPYYEQVSLLRKINANFDQAEKHVGYSNIMINTIEQFQGIDKDVILYSGTRTGRTAYQRVRSNGTDILEDKRNLNAVITRANYKLILVGDVAYLRKYGPFQEFFVKMPKMCYVVLSNGKDQFFWDTVLNGIQIKQPS